MNHDDQLDWDLAGGLRASAERAIPPGASVMAAVEARLGRAGRAGRRGAPRGRARPGRRALLPAAAAVVLLATVAAASPLAQAATSISANLLRIAGISPGQASRVVLPRGTTSATSAGYTIAVTGAFADQHHTVLLLHTSATAMPTDVAAADESGRALRLTDVLYGGGSDVAVELGPLPVGRHQVAVRVSAIQVSTTEGGPPAILRGDWRLRFTLDAGTTPTLAAAPSSGDLGSSHLSVDEIAREGHGLYVQLTIAGLTRADTVHGPEAVQAGVVDAASRRQPPDLLAFIEDGGPAGSARLTIRLYFQDVAGGAYSLVVTLGVHRFESRFTIP